MRCGIGHFCRGRTPHLDFSAVSIVVTIISQAQFALEAISTILHFLFQVSTLQDYQTYFSSPAFFCSFGENNLWTVFTYLESWLVIINKQHSPHPKFPSSPDHLSTLVTPPTWVGRDILRIPSNNSSKYHPIISWKHPLQTERDLVQL